MSEWLDAFNRRIAAKPPHHIAVAEHVLSSNTGWVQFRAFCRCGWDSEETDDKAEIKRRIAAHFADSGAVLDPAVITGLSWADGDEGET